MGPEPLIAQLQACGPAPSVAAECARHPYPFFLDSALAGDRLGRFSFVGCDPFLVMRASGRRVELVESGVCRQLSADPFDVLQRLLDRYRIGKGGAPFPFVGGAVGYLGYDLGRLVERLPGGPVDDMGLPDAALCFYDAVIAFDHESGEAYVVSTGQPESERPKMKRRASRRLQWLSRIAVSAGAGDARAPGPPCPPPAPGGLRRNFTRDAYLAAVRRVHGYIVAGDCYQVNLSQRFHAPWGSTPWSLYQRLRSCNPAPFGAYQDFGDFAILSASPERFLRRVDDVIETRPIKGTRPRGGTPQEDEALARELAVSLKDRAEHIMIVDLERNDLGRVAQTGTVTVDEMMALERYATVHHLASTIRGKLRPDRSVTDLLRATFPGGSITGAPKIRAMEIIDELEPTRRGVYTGAIGYFSATGDLDLNIAIRTIVLKGGTAYFQVGGGIVYDSEPEAEYQETLDKGRALIEALTGPERAPEAGRATSPSGTQKSMA